MRIAPLEVSIDDPKESLKVIYGHGTRFTKVNRTLSFRHIWADHLPKVAMV